MDNRSKPTGGEKCPWHQAELHYITTNATYAEVASEYKINQKVLERYATKHNWVDLRNNFRHQLADQIEFEAVLDVANVIHDWKTRERLIFNQIETKLNHMLPKCDKAGNLKLLTATMKDLQLMWYKSLGIAEKTSLTINQPLSEEEEQRIRDEYNFLKTAKQD